jgi:hypothetical protein
MNPIPRPFRTWIKGGAIIFGGIVTLNVGSTLTLKVFQFASENKRVRITIFSCKKIHCFKLRLCIYNVMSIPYSMIDIVFGKFVEKNSVAVYEL